MPARVGLAHPSICPYGAFETSDGVAVLIAIQNERKWLSFCTHFLHDPGLPRRPGFDSNTARIANRPDVDGAIASTFATLSRAEAAARLSTGNTAFGFVNNLAALARHPALRRVQVDTPNGPVTMAAPSVLHGDGAADLGPVLRIGEHSAAIRAEFADLSGSVGPG